MGDEWEKLKNKIAYLQGDLAPFEVNFLDRDSFRRFCDDLPSQVDAYREICITGYFSETIRETLQRIIKREKNVRLICPEFSLQSQRDKKEYGCS